MARSNIQFARERTSRCRSVPVPAPLFLEGQNVTIDCVALLVCEQQVLP
jgi:hypothetical protein